MSELCYIKNNKDEQYKNQSCLYTASGSLVCNGNGNSVNQILAEKTLVTGYKENAFQGDNDVVEHFYAASSKTAKYKPK